MSELGDCESFILVTKFHDILIEVVVFKVFGVYIKWSNL